MSINSLILEGMWDKKFIETGKKKKKEQFLFLEEFLLLCRVTF